MNLERVRQRVSGGGFHPFALRTSDGRALTGEGTGANRENGERNFWSVLCSFRSLLLHSGGKPEIREYKAMFVLNDEEIGIFSHELVVNCAPRTTKK
jgi:hypothetical protein